jgi:hypothetical protein
VETLGLFGEEALALVNDFGKTFDRKFGRKEIEGIYA